MVQRNDIWCPYGNWESIAKSEDLSYVRQRITGLKKGDWKPNSHVPGFDDVLRAISEDCAARGHGRGTVLDFGCGLGRNGQSLRNCFDRVIALDLPDMIAKLRQDPAAALYDALYDDFATALAKSPVDVVYESVVWQHIVDADYSATLASTIEAASGVRHVVSLNNSNSKLVPGKRGWSRTLAMLEARGWTLVFLAEDTKTFTRAHIQRVLRRPA